MFKKKCMLLCLILFLLTPFTFASWEAQVGADLSLYAGARVKFDLPKSFYISSGVGMSPAFLIETQSSLMTTVGLVNKLDARMFDDMLANSIYFDIRGGWYINGKDGFFMEAGYAYLGNGGRDSSETAVRDVLDDSSSSLDSIFTNQTMTAKATMHMLTIQGGYNWPINKSWVISASTGLVRPISTTSTFEFTNRTPLSDTTEADVTDAMQSTFKNMFLITANAWLAYRF